MVEHKVQTSIVAMTMSVLLLYGTADTAAPTRAPTR